MKRVIPSLEIALFAAIALSAVGCKPQIGDKCSLSIDCSQLGDRLCDTSQPEGYCTVFNCEPDTCPQESLCVGFNPVLDPACKGTDANKAPRFQRTFCVRICDEDSDCRAGYHCIDLTKPEYQASRKAQIVDLEPLGQRACLVALDTDTIVGQDGGVPDGGVSSDAGIPGVCQQPDAGPPWTPYDAGNAGTGSTSSSGTSSSSGGAGGAGGGP